MSDLKKQMMQDMFNSMREVLGTGYVKDYYLQSMDDFVSTADWYAKELIAEEKQALKQRLIDAVDESITFGAEGIGLCKTDYIAVSRLNELIEKVFSDK